MAGETPDLSGLLGGLLSSPAAMQLLSGLLGGAGGPPPREPPCEEGAPSPPPLPSPPHRGGRRDEREALLSALRPYLSDRRRQALTGACKLLEVIELLKEAGGEH